MWLVSRYISAKDWDAAQRVAEAHHPESIHDVLVGQARVAFRQQDYGRAETFLLRAQRADLVVEVGKRIRPAPCVGRPPSMP